MLTLKDIKVGEAAVVTRLQGEGPVKRRIMDMGITKGVEVFVRKVAPLGDPMELNVRGYELSIRKADADMIEVERLERKKEKAPEKDAESFGRIEVADPESPISIALAGNPNSGKTTMFNDLTGSNQYVGNWPGVTVEKKEGALRGYKNVVIQDLPGIYSLSPYTLEEVVTRNYLVGERPDAIINIVDGTNIERNLYLTTQLIELGVPVVVAVNMMDVVRRNGDTIDLKKLGKALGCTVLPTSALKGEGSLPVAKLAVAAAAQKTEEEHPHVFTGSVEHAIAHIEESVAELVEPSTLRWYAIKLFERDEKVLEELQLDKDLLSHIEAHIADCEKELKDDAQSIIINQRYTYISKVVDECVRKRRPKHGLSVSDRIDRVVTNRFLALPVFVAVMWLVYTVSIGTVGDWTVGFMNDTLFGEWIIPGVTTFLENIGTAPWLVSLVADGAVSGAGAVLGFVPQMLILFLMLSLLEDCGYMSRVAFIMDRLFRKFGLSGKSFIPMLVASGCGVPGVMASRTIEQDRDRKMTIMTTCFIPCGAKMPIVGLIASALFGGSALVATSAYFLGIGAAVISGLILKKTKPFAGEPAPFVMELPAYHMPVASNILRTTWERGWSFVKRAGTVIMAAGIILWILNSLSFEGGLHYISEEVGGASILELIGGGIATLFKPLGFGSWQAAVATILGLMAKEEVVGVFGSLSSMGEGASYAAMGLEFFGGSKLAGYSFMAFNLLCAPCFAAMGAIKREMNNAKWTWAAIGWMTGFAYAVSLIIYQLGGLFTGEAAFGLWTVVAAAVLAAGLYMLFRKSRYNADYTGKRIAVDVTSRETL